MFVVLLLLIDSGAISEHYSQNEDSYLDWNGEMIQRHHRTTALIEEDDLNREADFIIANAHAVAWMHSDIASEFESGKIQDHK